MTRASRGALGSYGSVGRISLPCTVPVAWMRVLYVPLYSSALDTARTIVR